MPPSRSASVGIKPELQLPEPLAAQVWEAAGEAERALAFDLSAAIQASQRELDLLYEAEEIANRRLHKGHPLHNLGVALWRARPADSRRHFLAAHVEDSRLWPRRKPRHWEFLATRMLTSLFRESERVLHAAARLGRQALRRDPLAVADEAMALTPPPDLPQRVVDVLEEEALRALSRDRRIFVGGSYPYSLDRIDVIERAVREEGYEPVVVQQYRTLPGERARVKSFRLLDLCSAAAFESSARVDPGWWSELERVVQVKPMACLVTYFSQEQDRLHTSSMFPTEQDLAALVTTAWGDHSHLHDVVVWWIRNRLSGSGSMGATSPSEVEDSNEAAAPWVQPGVSVAVPSGSPYALPNSGTGSVAGSAIPYAPPDEAH